MSSMVCRQGTPTPLHRLNTQMNIQAVLSILLVILVFAALIYALFEKNELNRQEYEKTVFDDENSDYDRLSKWLNEEKLE